MGTNGGRDILFLLFLFACLFLLFEEKEAINSVTCCRETK